MMENNLFFPILASDNQDPKHFCLCCFFSFAMSHQGYIFLVLCMNNNEIRVHNFFVPL